MSRAACTIVSPNYLPLARTLAASYVAQHPDHRFFVLIVADLRDPSPFRVDAAFVPVMLEEIGLPDLRATAMKYDILELNTNVKPTFLKHLIASYDLDAVVYLDPDICIYAPLDPVFAHLEQGATAVLTPHLTTPVFDGRRPSEQDMLYNGTYNLGFVALSSNSEAHRLLDWWEQRCLTVGFSEGRTGLFVDQKWANLMPGLFAGVTISRDAGLNMAYWNLHERTLVVSAGGYAVQSAISGTVPLRFFHFSGLDCAAPSLLSRNNDRFTLPMRPDLGRLFAEYCSAVGANQMAALQELPFGFDRFSDGTAVTRLARRIFAAHELRFREADGSAGNPFEANGAFARFARAKGLVRGRAGAEKSTWREFDPKDRRVLAVHRILRGALRLLGPHRYELLMRYLAHIAVLRHQAVFLRERDWPDLREGTEAQLR